MSGVNAGLAGVFHVIKVRNVRLRNTRTSDPNAIDCIVPVALALAS